VIWESQHKGEEEVPANDLRQGGVGGKNISMKTAGAIEPPPTPLKKNNSLPA